jgi:hypothetical protein
MLTDVFTCLAKITLLFSLFEHKDPKKSKQKIKKKEKGATRTEAHGEKLGSGFDNQL